MPTVVSLVLVDPPAVLKWRRSGKHRLATLRELLSGNKPVVAHPDEYLDGVIERMSLAKVVHIPVISREDRRLVGYIGWKDLMNVRIQQRAKDKDRVVFYRVR